MPYTTQDMLLNFNTSYSENILKNHFMLDLYDAFMKSQLKNINKLKAGLVCICVSVFGGLGACFLSFLWSEPYECNDNQCLISPEIYVAQFQHFL